MSDTKTLARIAALEYAVEELNKAPSVAFKKLDPAAIIPDYQTAGAAGMDICALNNFKIWSNDFEVINTGLAVEIPPGYEIQVRSRSGLAAKHGLAVLNSPGTIDADYRGEIKVILYNHGPHTFDGEAGTRIAQLVVVRAVQAQIFETVELTETARGAGGLGSTGT